MDAGYRPSFKKLFSGWLSAMTIQTRQLFIAICLYLAGPVYAEDVTVFVDGRSGPWDISANTAFSYGVVNGGVPDSHLRPTSVSGASGLPFMVGDYLTIQYMSGLAVRVARTS